MAIRLTVNAEDAEVERLLAHLQSSYKMPTSDKVYLLERAIKWLRATEAITYNLNPDHSDSIHLQLDKIGATTSVPVDTHCVQH